MHTCTYTYTYTYTHTLTHTYIHTHTHTYTFISHVRTISALLGKSSYEEASDQHPSMDVILRLLKAVYEHVRTYR